jgi:hypothetical protein
MLCNLDNDNVAKLSTKKYEYMRGVMIVAHTLALSVYVCINLGQNCNGHKMCFIHLHILFEMFIFRSHSELCLTCLHFKGYVTVFRFYLKLVRACVVRAYVFV